jgi:CO/xanthine dehydrogenase FAD-binding subunit
VAGFGGQLRPTGDVNASAAYKQHVAEVLVERAVVQALGRARHRA